MTVSLDWYGAEDIDAIVIPMERTRNNYAQSVNELGIRKGNDPLKARQR